jgi:hypothetical protein
MTIFEKHYINEGKKIKYICFKFWMIENNFKFDLVKK